MTVARYTLGVAALLAVALPLAAGSIVLRRRFYPTWTGALARLAEIVIWFALLVGLLELLGTLRLFRLAPIVIGSVLLGWAITRAAGTGRAGSPRAAPASRSGVRRLAAVSALAAGGVVIAEWAAPTLTSYDHGIRTFDSLWYHLPWAASYAQTGQVTGLRFTDVEYLTPFYPATAEVLHGLGLVLLGRDTLSPWANLVWLALVLLAGWCVGRRYDAGPVTLAGAALAMAVPMVRFSQAGSAANDIVGVFFLLAGAAFALGGEGAPAADALAAVGCGLAISVKLSLLAPALALALGAVLVAPAGTRRAAAARWAALLVLAGGFWYVRNLIAVGNPLPWLNLPGLAIPAPPLQAHTGFSVAHYLTTGGLWSSTFVPGLRAGFGPWWPAVLILAVLSPLLCLLPPAAARVRMLGVVALFSLLVYLLTPESAAGPAGHPLGFAFNLRYATPGLTLCLTVLGLAAPLRRPGGRAFALALLLVLLGGTLAEARLWPHPQLAGAVLLGALFAVSAAVALGLRRLRLPLLAGAALLAAAAAAAGYPMQRHYLRGRYAYQPGISSLSGVWALFRSVHHARVGIVGTFGGFFSYPLYGLDDSNRVSYIGHRGPHGSFTAIRSCPAWRRAVDAAHLRYLVTTPARDPWRPRALEASPETSWTIGRGGARPMYRITAKGQPIAVFELRAPLDPAGCPTAR